MESPIERFVFKYINRVARVFGARSFDVGSESVFGRENYKRAKLRAAVARFQPDWVLVIRAHQFVDAALVADLKSNLGVQKVVGWNVDGPGWAFDLLADAAIFDRYFCIHREGYEPARDRIEYLPAFGVDTELYHPGQIGPGRFLHDIVFVGGANSRRQAIVEKLLDLPLEIYGSWLHRRNRFKWALRKRVRAKGIWGADVVALYRSSRIVLNISSWDPVKFGGLNLRIFDVPACGAFLLTDFSPELAEFYTLGKDIVCFDNVDDLREKLSYYLEHEEEREAIARSGYERSLSLPTVTDRIRCLIAAVDEDGCEQHCWGQTTINSSLKINGGLISSN